MKILVTGGAGFIGSNVTDAYIENGHEVIVVDDLSSGRIENINPQARFYPMDIRSKEIATLIAVERPEVINHHAAQISVPASVDDPSFDASINIMGLINLLEAARANAVRKVIFISSGGAIYGEALEYPTTEEAPLAPASPYAIAKCVSESYLAFYKAHYGLDYTTLRYSNVYGPRQIPKGEAGVVAIFTDHLLAGRRCTIFESDDMPEGMIRDYVYVDDVVKANIAALEKGSGQAYNIATGTGTRTRELYDVILNAIGERMDTSNLPGTPEKAPARRGDLKRSCLDTSKAIKELGWKPSWDLKKGIQKTLSWRLSQ